MLALTMLLACADKQGSSDGPEDGDGDGFSVQTDCEDGDASIHPDAPEICDGTDNDCNGLIDDGDDNLDLSSATTFYTDGDGDGYGDSETPVQACIQPEGTAEEGGDCRDDLAWFNPGATETCNGSDDDCDGLVDDTDDDWDTSSGETGHLDLDGDRFGDPESLLTACQLPGGYIANGTDCDDGSPWISPAATELVQDGIDQDCSGADDEHMVAIGVRHNCVINSWGALHCWGTQTGWTTDYGQVSEMPSGQFMQVSSSEKHSCAIDTEGSIQCWGQQNDAPEGTFLQVSAGEGHSCAIDTEGGLHCWGAGQLIEAADTGQPDTGSPEMAPAYPEGVFLDVSAGEAHSCAVDLEGSVHCWGEDAYGQVSEAPTGAFVQVSAGTHHSCALDASGQVQCWGADSGEEYIDCGQASDAPFIAMRRIDVGQDHSCGITTADALHCWGAEGTCYEEPGSQITDKPIGQFRSLSAGQYSNCAISNDGELKCWVYLFLDYGQSTPDWDGDGYDQLSDCDDNRDFISPGKEEVCDRMDNDCDGLADDEDGSLAGDTLYPDADGDGYSPETVSTLTGCTVEGYGPFTGDCDDGDFNVHPYAAERVLDGIDQDCDGSDEVAMVSAGGTYSCAIGASGSASCWGYDSYGITDGAPDGEHYQVGSGYWTACVLDTEGMAQCWGHSWYDLVEGVPETPLQSLATGQSLHCGLGLDGELHCWGSYAGYAPEGVYVGANLEAQSGCAILPGGMLDCWSSGSSQLFYEAQSRRYVQAVGDNSSGCGLEAGGAIQCWGSNTYGEGSPPAGSFTRISGSGERRCALDATGAITCWGTAAGSDPAGTYTHISIGGGQSCAISTDGSLHCWAGTDTVSSDSDGDGYDAIADCDNADSGIFPSAAEICDGIDNDCDQLADDDDPGLEGDALFTDSDGDGFGSEAAGSGCKLPGHSAIAGDCDDGDFATAPLRPDRRMDGIDQDCDGSDEQFSFAAGSGLLCVIDAYGEPYCWSGSAHGEPGPGDYLLVTGHGSNACALDQDLLLQCWDSGGLELYDPPMGPFSVVYSTCALDDSGTPSCWGDDSYGQVSDMPPGPFASISTGREHSCAIDEDETIQCWGNTSFWYTEPTYGHFQQIAAGDEYSCALDIDGTIQCWGSYYSDVVNDVPGGVYTRMAGSMNAVCALDPDGELYCFGNDYYDELSEAPSGSYRNLFSSSYGFCAVSTDDVLACWGSVPSADEDGDGWDVLWDCDREDSGIHPGADEVCDWGVDNDCSGLADEDDTGLIETFPLYPDEDGDGFGVDSTDNLDGCLADGYGLVDGDCDDGDFTVHPFAPEIPLDGIDQDCDGADLPAMAAAGSTHSCATGEGSEVSCWGNDPVGSGDWWWSDHGQVSETPAGQTACMLDASYYASCVLDSAGEILCWGSDNYGESYLAPSGAFHQLSISINIFCAIDTAGQLSCWGSSSTTPPSGSFIQVGTGRYHACGLDSNLQIQCWGYASLSSAIPPPDGHFLSIGIGYDHGCAIDLGQELVCWGDDSRGQATPPAGTFVRVSAGMDHSCAIGTDGSTQCWGDISTPPEAALLQISSSADNACGTDAEGGIHCWGDNSYGQLNVP
jgi:alpha-tubulin suppressor-like RCC1 family protein